MSLDIGAHFILATLAVGIGTTKSRPQKYKTLVTITTANHFVKEKESPKFTKIIFLL